MMTRIPRAVICFSLRSYIRNFGRSIGNLPKIKVISDDNKDSMKISFEHGPVIFRNNKLSLSVSREQPLCESLLHIKKLVHLQRQKQELRRSVINKYSDQEEEIVSEEYGDEFDVSLIHNDRLLEATMKSFDAWIQGSLLKIGDTIYEVNRNIPTVSSLSLPDCILAGCIIRPHFVLECAELADCRFLWYRSIEENELNDFNESLLKDKENVLKDEEQLWVKVGEGFTYFTSADDVGCKLKLVCIPKQGDRSGPPFSVESVKPVESGPESFPFEDRHLFTKQLADKDSIRCTSYNILANIYVENRKFPYCSKKAKDIYYRKQLLLRELLGYNSDIICLQEVQERVFLHDLLPVFKARGFDGFYNRKGGKRYEGLACFFRTSKFKVIHNHGVFLNEVIKEKEIFVQLLTKISGNLKGMSKTLAQDTAFQIVLLEDIEEPKRRILVANTHLYSNKDTPEVRLIQTALCTCYAEHILKMEDPNSTALLFCGDFNSMPTSEVFKFITSGSFECCSSWKNNDTVSDTTLRHNLSLDSACGTPFYTNYTEEFNGCLDYIFYSKNCLSVSEVVPMPSHEMVIKEVALPSELFPSDHIALVCTLKWKEQ